MAYPHSQHIPPFPHSYRNPRQWGLYPGEQPLSAAHAPTANGSVYAIPHAPTSQMGAYWPHPAPGFASSSSSTTPYPRVSSYVSYSASTGHGMPLAWGGSAHSIPHAPEPSQMASYKTSFASSSSTMHSNGGLNYWAGDDGPSVASTRAPGWSAPPSAGLYNDGAGQFYTPYFSTSTSRQGDVYNDNSQRLAFPDPAPPPPAPVRSSEYSSLSMALSMSVPQYHTAQQAHSSQNIDAIHNPSESVNLKENGHGTLDAVLGTVNTPEAATSLVNGLTETSESPRPMPSPTDYHHRDTPNPATSSKLPLRKRKRLLPYDPSHPKAATPATPPRASRNEGPSHATADACASGQSSHVHVTFHAPIVCTNAVPTSPKAPVRAVFPDEHPVAKPKRMDPEAEKTSGLSEILARLVFKEWEKLSKRMDNGEEVRFDGYIKSMEVYDDVSTKLLRCLEDDCLSKDSTHYFTRSEGLKKHFIGQHFKRKVGESKRCYLARKAAAKNRWKWEENYDAMIKDYRSLKDLVVATLTVA